MLAVILAFLGEFREDFYVCYNNLQANGGNKDDGQMIVPVENRICPPLLEKREVGSFRNLTWLQVLYRTGQERQHCQVGADGVGAE